MNKDLLKKKILSEISNSSFVYAPYQGWWDDADIEEDLEDFEDWINESFPEFFEKNLFKDKKFYLEIVKLNGMLLRFADETLQKDKGLVLAALNNCGRALQEAHKSLLKDEDVVLNAIENDEYAEKNILPLIKDEKLKKYLKIGIEIEKTRRRVDDSEPWRY